MSDLRAIKLLKSLLRHRERWELACIISDEFYDIRQKALSIATERLKSISLLSLWRGYCKWVRSKPILKNSDDYFHAFIEDIAWNIAVKGLTGRDKDIFNDLGYFKFKFI